MRIYETTFIVNPQTDDSTIDSQVNAVTDLIKEKGGEILRENRMGTRRLAYPIAGLVQGFYTSIIFNGDISVPSVLDRYYRLEEPYVRHLTILFEGDPNADPEEKYFGFPSRDVRRPYHKADEPAKPVPAKQAAKDTPDDQVPAEPVPAKQAAKDTPDDQVPAKPVDRPDDETSKTETSAGEKAAPAADDAVKKDVESSIGTTDEKAPDDITSDEEEDEL